MNMVEVPHEVFERAGVRRVCGFEFMYNPEDPKYGVCLRTDGTLPPIASVVEAGRVGGELQRFLFNGQAAEPVTRMHW